MLQYLLYEGDVFVGKFSLEVEHVEADRNILLVKDNIDTVMKEARGFFFNHLKLQAEDGIEQATFSWAGIANAD